MRVVCSKAMRDAGSAVMRQHGKSFEAAFTHHRERVQRHLALGVIAAALTCLRPPGIAVAPQVHRDDREIPCQLIRDEVPHRMSLGVAMQQQERIAPPTAAHPEANAIAHRILGFE